MNNKKLEQKSGDASENYQAGRDINIYLGNLPEIASKVNDTSFKELTDDAKRIVEKNQGSLLSEFQEQISLIQDEIKDLKQTIVQPDFQYVAKSSLITAARTDSIEIHKILANLLVKRIMNSSDDALRLVCNEALLQLDKLSISQIRLLSLCFLLVNSRQEDVKSLEDFKNFLSTYSKLISAFEISKVETNLLIHSNFANLYSSFKLNDFYKSLFENYRDAFDRKIPKGLIDNDKYAEFFVNNLVDKSTDDYYFLKEFEDIRKLSEELRDKYKDQYSVRISPIFDLNKFYGDFSSIEDDILMLGDVGKLLIDKIKDTSIFKLSLTPIGFTIALIYLEAIFDETINLQMWLSDENPALKI